MPSPIGHALGGLLVGILFPGGGGSSDPPAKDIPSTADQSAGRMLTAGLSARELCWQAGLKTRLYWWTVIVACLPDLDFLWGRHNMETHSIGFAVIVGLAILAWTRRPWLAIASTLAVGTHVMFDWLGSDDTPPLGVMALWPLSGEFYFANAFVFEAISRRYWLPNFYTHNLLAVLRELALLLPAIGVAWFVQRRRSRSE